MTKQLSLLCILTILYSSCAQKLLQNEHQILFEAEYEIVSVKTDLPKREFRGAWVATIANIDWPSEKGLHPIDQKDEFLEIVEHHKKRGINALLVQVRAASDAFYAKSSEPWSEWLNGKQGEAPVPFYDPMEFMIEEAHYEGMEFHAWLNLNRGLHRLSTSVEPNHIVYRKPNWFLDYGNYKLYNFGIPEVRTYIKEIVLNIVREYDVDGIHFDDYFYPYKVNGQNLNDASTFRKYPNGYQNIEDWRRGNINTLIKELSDAIRQEKAWVKFGISPFGVWRNQSDDPKGSNTRGGQPSYDFLYADTKKWADEGWIDYIAPQIYFPFEHKLVPYGILTKWWMENHGKALFYVGHGNYKIDKNAKESAWKDPNQISRQLDYNRKSNEVSGSIFYNTNTFMQNNLGHADSIQARYNYQVLSPQMDWKVVEKSDKPVGFKTKKSKLGLRLSWDASKDNSFVLYRFEKDPFDNKLNIEDPLKIITICSCNQFIDKTRKRNKQYIYLLSALDRMQNESDYTFFIE